MEFHFALAKKSRGWLVTKIRCLNLKYHMVPHNRQDPAFYPSWFSAMVAEHLNTIGTTTKEPRY